MRIEIERGIRLFVDIEGLGPATNSNESSKNEEEG